MSLGMKALMYLTCHMMHCNSVASKSTHKVVIH